MTWTEEALRRVGEDGTHVHVAFPGAARRARAEGLDGERVRIDLLLALPGDADAVAALVQEVYEHGDSAEKLAVLRALPELDRPTDRRAAVGDRLLPVVRDALRTNDTRLVAAAMGPYTRTQLEATAWRQGVVKALFTGIPLAMVDGLDERSDDTLVRMVSDFADERRAAGREVPADAWLVLADSPSTDHGRSLR